MKHMKHSTLEGLKEHMEQVDRAHYLADPERIAPLLAEYPGLACLMDVALGETFLHRAVESGIDSRVEYCLELGIDIDVPDKIGGSPLHLAADLDDGHMCKLLVERGANIEARDNDGFTPLLAAASVGAGMAMEQLLADGADPWARNKHGHSILTVFVRDGHKRDWGQALAAGDLIVKLLLEHGKAGELLDELNREIGKNPKKFEKSQGGLGRFVCMLENAVISQSSVGQPGNGRPARRM